MVYIVTSHRCLELESVSNQFVTLDPPGMRIWTDHEIARMSRQWVIVNRICWVDVQHARHLHADDIGWEVKA